MQKNIGFHKKKKLIVYAAVIKWEEINWLSEVKPELNGRCKQMAATNGFVKVHGFS